MCGNFGIHLDQFVVRYPRDFHAAFEELDQRRLRQEAVRLRREAIARKRAEAKTNAALAAIALRLAKALRKGKHDQYQAIMPRNCDELRAEGNAMHNCIGGYGDRIAAGKCVCVFVRDAEGEPFADIEIKDGKFEFHKDTVMMAKILMDYHYRFNTQVLLVVTDPGTVEVVIDSVSSAKGTPQNDVLQRWKETTEAHNAQMGSIHRAMNEGKLFADTLRLKALKMRGDSIHLAYKQASRAMAKEMDDCVLKDFLDKMFPLTYKRKMPDGTIVEMDADTNQPVNK